MLAVEAAAAPNRTVEVNSLMRTVCLDMVGRAAFSLDLGAMADPDRDITRSYLHGFDVGKHTPLFLKLLQICPDPLKIFASTVVSNTILRVNISSMESLIRDTVVSKLKVLRETKDASCEESPSDTSARDLMDAICSRGQPQLSERALTRHALTTLAGSVEMVSNELSWAIYTLSLPENQITQERLRDEIRNRFPGASPESVAAADIAAMPYLNGVVSEVLRLFPSVAARFRVCHTPTTLLGRAIHKGTLVLYPIYSMNRNQNVWGSDADEFRPERWTVDSTPNASGGNGTQRDAYSFMTFGQGSRKCPGEHYTRVVMACMILGLVDRFRLTLPPEGDVLGGSAEKVGFGVVMKAPITVMIDEVVERGRFTEQVSLRET